MNNIFESFAQSLSFENNVSIDKARQLVEWMSTEGVLDYDLLKETYDEQEVGG